MRGKLQESPMRAGAFRNIPAYAGKTPPVFSLPLASAEHPRVCGENTCKLLKYLWINGTSPRMRGKPPPGNFATTSQRNIPAYAGKTHCRQKRHNQGKEHPRVCGENWLRAWLMR